MAAERIDIPAWLDAAVDQRLAFVAEGLAGLPLGGDTVVTTPLRERADGETHEHWDRSCDNCGRFVAPNTGDGEMLYTGSITRNLRGQMVVVLFGVCKTCKDAD